MPTCHKVPHPTREQAEHARFLMKREGRAPGTSNVYKCQLCGAWHWGRVPKQNRRTKIKGWRG